MQLCLDMLWPDLEFLWSIPMDLRGVQSVGTVGHSSTSERAWFEDGFRRPAV